LTEGSGAVPASTPRPSAGRTRRAAATVAALAALALLAACTGLPQAPAQLPETVLQPGDRIDVQVYNHDDLSRELVIDPGGTAALPLAGSLPLAGLTVEAAERMVTAALSPAYLRAPQVAIAVSERPPVYILGEVRRPGRYPYGRGLTVLQAVAVAGGYTYRAREGSVTIVRGAPDGSRRALRGGPATPLRPGDTLRVHERFF
jgi:polysaccharide export outer membrane protein